ncbi:MAG: hypothetical protein GWO86_01385 [Planctomycetes bacterium]|nr:hypothetical protein [Planctomycetota bacterium]
MKKNTALKILNPILMLLLVSQAVTALFSVKLSHETFTILHKGGGTMLIALAALHLILNFNWVKTCYCRK